MLREVDQVILCQLVPVVLQLPLDDVVRKFDAPEVAGVLGTENHQVSAVANECQGFAVVVNPKVVE